MQVLILGQIFSENFSQSPLFMFYCGFGGHLKKQILSKKMHDFLSQFIFCPRFWYKSNSTSFTKSSKKIIFFQKQALHDNYYNLIYLSHFLAWRCSIMISKLAKLADFFIHFQMFVQIAHIHLHKKIKKIWDNCVAFKKNCLVTW